MSETTRQVVLDVDVGIDDALMMLYLAGDPRAQIVAVGSVHGNCSAAQAAINALRVMEAAELPDVPVAQGSESPLPGAPASPHVHGADGLGDVGLPPPRGAISGEHAVEQLLRLGSERPGELDLIAVGTMTNLAAALERDPRALQRYRSVMILGGLAAEPAAETLPFFDANVYNSPEAAARLLASGAPLTVTAIDLSRRAQLSPAQIERILAGTTPLARFAAKILPPYVDFYTRRFGRRTASMHDPLAAALLLDPSLIITTFDAPMRVEPHNGSFRAIARPGSSNPPVRIVSEADLPRFLDHFVETIAGPRCEVT